MSDELRDRLHELAEEATPELSDRARRRVVDAVRLEGPALVHGGASRRRAIIFGGAVALAAAAALAFVVAGPGASDDGVADMSAPACQAWDPAAQASDAARYDLGARGLVAVDGTASLSATDPCLTTVHLSDGRVDVRADDLGGGVLRVDAGPVAVEVRGTRFAVTRHGDDITVAVTEGHVVVTAPEEREIDLRDGERWSLGQELAMLGPQREGNGNGNGSGSGSGSGNGDGNGNGNASGNGDANGNGNGNGDGSGDGSGNGGGNGNGNANGNANGNGSGNADGNGDGNGNGNGNASGSGNGNASGSGNGNASGHVDPSALLSRAEALWRDEQRGAARRVFRQVGQGDSTLAEASWVRLARLELRAGNTRGALSALRTRSRRFSEGRLGAESLWLEADAYRRLGDDTSRRRVISELQRRHPDSPQARAAARQIE